MTSRRTTHTALVLLVIGGLGPAAVRAGDDKKLAEAAQGFLKKYCADCHTGPKPKSGAEDYDVLSYASLTKKHVDDGKDWYYVKPGARGEQALKDSELWQQAGVFGKAGSKETMPPATFDKMKVKLQPTAAERANILQKWLEAGAPPFPKAKAGKDTPGLSQAWFHADRPVLVLALSSLRDFHGQRRL